MANDLLKFPAGIMDKGVDIYGPKFRSDLVLDIETYNVTDGKSQGIGIVYGKSPLPGQSDAETPTGTRCNNIRYSEDTSSATRGLTRRTRFLKLIPVTMGEFDNLTSQKQFFAALVSKSSALGADDYLDVILLSEYEEASGPLYYYERVRTLYSGLHPSTWDGDTSNYLKTELLLLNAPTTNGLLNYFRYDANRPFIPATVLQVSNKRIPMQWLYGQMLNPGSVSATVPPNVNLWFWQTTGGSPGTYPLVYCGLPSQNRKNANVSQRQIRVYGINQLASYVRQWEVSFDLNANPTAIQGGSGYDDAAAHYNLSAITPTSSSTRGIGGSMTAALINDAYSFTESGYTAILACGDKPVAIFLQDWIYQDDKKSPLWVDLTEPILFPRPNKYSPYTEDSLPKSNCFKLWPNFVRGTTMVNSTAGGAGLVAGGILQQDTVYEFAFSFYNKRLNFETNVGQPVKIQVGNTGDVAISLCTSAGVTPRPGLFSTWLNSGSGAESVLDFPFMDGNFPPAFAPIEANEFFKFMNYLEYRFYYRVEGSFEWLPAGNFDAAQLWFQPNAEFFAIVCKGEVAALPGGQPGGFNDYSPLPKQRYRCVVNYKNRAWWVSSTSIFFSLENNIFAYPVRNAITAQTGEFLGALVHNYPGEAEQTSRLIIFASNAIYVARFTGDKSYQAIRVSPVTVAEFPVDASDLVIDLWTTVSSFSERSAVVAEGILYYWGAQGIHRDNGTDTPEKISKRLEPDIFSLYDPTKTDEIFCSYNAVTKEITWFYQPRTADATYPRHMLVYNIESDQFLFGKTSDLVDDIYQVDLKNTDHPDLSAQRTIAHVRKASDSMIQHPYFYDLKNQAGSMNPKTEFVVKTISTPATGQRRLTLAAGYDATNFATIVAGDYIALNQTKAYATSLTNGDSMIAQIAAISTGSGYLDIILPDGGDLDSSATLTYDKYFPIWHRGRLTAGLNGIPWQIKTGYWLPSGVNNSLIWQWIYMLLQYSEWPKPTGSNTFTMAYRTPSGGPEISDVIRFVENSDGAMQLLHALRQGYLNNQGQALKMTLSGIHIGEPWVLQYLEAHCTIESGNTLKQYQG